MDSLHTVLPVQIASQRKQKQALCFYREMLEEPFEGAQPEIRRLHTNWLVAGFVPQRDAGGKQQANHPLHGAVPIN